MKYVQSQAVYMCCATYYVCDDSVKDKKCTCQKCGKELKPKLKVPHIVMIKK